eukprot:TRINITY_DN10347_c0_g1_i1.p1 TRINITY_DN10347_c0_g1~~TRINITY_DN10347_c0_g1_i1.p1  ORF type:complete len:471 (+),score=94.72 TRINITY_DN10347_c0_g1_i1:63-1475(+)
MADDANSRPEVAATSSAAGTSRWSPVFEAVLSRILAEYEGSEDKVRDGMETGMRRLFEKPYEDELGSALGKKPLQTEDAQRIIFAPRLSDMKAYASCFHLVTPEDTARRAMLMKFKLMSVFYTCHRYDGALMDRFMHIGGLESLVTLLGEQNRVVQSQVVELLQEMLSPQISLPTARSSRQAHIQHQVYACLTSTHYWRNLGRIIAEPAEVFPKSHISSMRLLAGAVGWLRLESELGAVPEAGMPSEVKEACDALKQCLDNGPPLPPDVRGLGEDLLEELQSVPTIRPDPLRGEALANAKKILFDPEAQSQEDAGQAWQALKKLGNEAIGKGLFWPAEGTYRLALEEGAAALPPTEGSIIASNRALALLKAGHHAEAAESASDALERNPNNAKAAFRRAQALLEQPASSLTDPAGTIHAAVDAAEIAVKLEPTDAKVAEILSQAKQRLSELRVSEQSGESQLVGGLEGMD